MDNKHQFSIWYFVFAFLFIAYLQSFFNPPRVENLPYSEFKILLKANKLENIRLTESDISGTILLRGIDDYLPYERIKALNINSDVERSFYTVRLDDPKLIDDLEVSGISFAGKKENRWLGNVVSWVIPILLFLALWSYLFRRMGSLGGSMMEIGKSKVKVYVEKDTKVTFADVAGVEEAKEELQEIVNFLNDPQGYSKLGARIPKGILLVGPPGTGKTLLARAVAGEAGVPFFSINGSEFVEMFVGVGAARVRDLFNQAREKAPAIIFIDELDALGRARGISPAGGGHDEKEQTLNQLLSEMDGFDPSKGLVLLSATNRPEILDPALLRAGRFDRQVLVDRPDKVGRVQILKVHIKKIHLANDINLESIAALTPGFTGADLANLVNEAALLATRRKGDEVTLDDFTQAIERIVAGLEKKNRLLNPKEREVVAHHEMGHALVAMSLPGVDPVHKISIIPRGIGALGYTIQRPTEDRYLMTREELENKMAVLLGGRASEQLIFKHLSTGAADDLAKATNIARSMVTRYGMDEKLGQVVYQEDAPLFLEGVPGFNKRDFSEETAREIDCAVRELVNGAIKKATNILKNNRDVLERGAKMLLEQETLAETELETLQQQIPLAAITKI
jgi:cell division protease FtsH